MVVAHAASAAIAQSEAREAQSELKAVKEKRDRTEAEARRLREERRRRLEIEKERLDNQRVRDAMREVKTFSHPVCASSPSSPCTQHTHTTSVETHLLT